MKSLRLDAIHFRILTESDYRKGTLFKRFGQIFSFKKIVSLLIFCRENQSGQLYFTAGSAEDSQSD
jgi:hypothetical protein